MRQINLARKIKLLKKDGCTNTPPFFIEKIWKKFFLLFKVCIMKNLLSLFKILLFIHPQKIPKIRYYFYAYKVILFFKRWSSLQDMGIS